MIAICLTIIISCLLALAVVLTLHFTRVSRDAYWRHRAHRLASVMAERQFRLAGLQEKIARARAVISSNGSNRAVCSGTIDPQAELDAAEWTGS